MRKLVIATGNQGKIRDFQSVFDQANIEVKVQSIQSFGGMPDVDETEEDFKGNAVLKAIAAKKAISDEDCFVLADDSGLSVDFLNGAPGVRSARYAGPDAIDADNRKKLLSEMKNVNDPERTAAFVCSLCLITPEKEEIHFEGRCHGKIARQESGKNGFGYDSLFIPNGETQTWGEIETQSKNENSHRGQACKKLIDWFDQ